MNDMTELDARFQGAEMSPQAAARQAPAGQATMVEQARAIAEVRAAVMIAMDRPRDRTRAIEEMREVCGIQGLAERAFFRVPRGGEHVNGETIHLARELARCWGNIDYGVKELVRDDVRGQSELLAFCWDMQTNTRSEITFIVPHVKGRANRRLTGTQEIYENNASFAGRRLREAIFAVLPVWFKAEAAELCHRTLEQGGGKPLIQRIADLRLAFSDDLNITAAQLERKRGRRIDDFLPEDVAALRIVYLSLKRGEVTVADEFPPEHEPPPPASKLEALEAAANPAPLPQNSPAGIEQTKGGGTTLDRPAGEAPAPVPDAPEPGQPDMLGRSDMVPLPKRSIGDMTAADWDYWARKMEAAIDEASGNRQRLAGIKIKNEGALRRLKDVDFERYQTLMRALAA